MDEDIKPRVLKTKGRCPTDVNGAADFVKKLYNILESEQFNDIVSWSSGRDSFLVKDMAAFTSTILPSHFKHSNFASFVRQLNKYDFHKVKYVGNAYQGGGTSMGVSQIWEFHHPQFKSGMRHNLQLIKRKAAKTKADISPTGDRDYWEFLQDQLSALQQRQDVSDARYEGFIAEVCPLLDQQSRLASAIIAHVPSPSPALRSLCQEFSSGVADLASRIGGSSMSNGVGGGVSGGMDTGMGSQSVAGGTSHIPNLSSSTGLNSVNLGQSVGSSSGSGNSNGLGSTNSLGNTMGNNNTNTSTPNTNMGMGPTLNSSLPTHAPHPPPAGGMQKAPEHMQYPMMQHVDMSSLPPQVPSQVPMQQLQLQNLQSGSTQLAPTAHWSVQPRVLLVEDDVVCRSVSSKFLQIFGCSIDVAFDGVTAVSKMNDDKYDIVLMDIMMPNMDGVSATTLIRQFDPNTPIISMTSNSNPDEVLNYLSHGMNDILPKPFTKDCLLQMLEKHLYHLRVIQQMAGIPRAMGFSEKMIQYAIAESATNEEGDIVNPFSNFGMSDSAYVSILKTAISSPGPLSPGLTNPALMHNSDFDFNFNAHSPSKGSEYGQEPAMKKSRIQEVSE